VWCKKNKGRESQLIGRIIKLKWGIFMLCFTMGMAANPLFSQAFELGSWSLINVKYNNREKLSFFGEAQLRSLKFYNQFHYYEFKGGLNTKYKRMLQLL
jgi:hypothetical protein